MSMSKSAFKNVIFVLFSVLFLILLFWLYNNLGQIEVGRQLVFQCQDGEWENTYAYFVDVNELCNEYPEFKNQVEQQLSCKIENIDPNEYRFLKVCGGEIESFTMSKNTKNWFPNIKYKKELTTISVYFMRNDRNIELSDD